MGRLTRRKESLTRQLMRTNRRRLLATTPTSTATSTLLCWMWHFHKKAGMTTSNCSLWRGIPQTMNTHQLRWAQTIAYIAKNSIISHVSKVVGLPYICSLQHLPQNWWLHFYILTENATHIRQLTCRGRDDKLFLIDIGIYYYIHYNSN